MDAALGTFAHADSEAFFYAVVAEAMEAFLDDACVFDVGEADGAVEFGGDYLNLINDRGVLNITLSMAYL